MLQCSNAFVQACLFIVLEALPCGGPTESARDGDDVPYRRIVMNTLFGSSTYLPNGPQQVKPKLW